MKKKRLWNKIYAGGSAGDDARGGGAYYMDALLIYFLRLV